MILRCPHKWECKHKLAKKAQANDVQELCQAIVSPFATTHEKVAPFQRLPALSQAAFLGLRQHQQQEAQELDQ